MKAYVDLEDPWPWPEREFGQEEFVNSVAQDLWNPARRSRGGKPRPPDMVQHFACHCDTRADSDSEYYLKLSHDPVYSGSERVVTIEDLRSSFGTFGANRQPQGDALPLVFLNACGSSVINPMSISSFPQLILNNGNCGFIGTETEVPDQVAAAFSKSFYTHLLEGDSLGVAIYEARWALLREHKNPLGILYTMYADPDITVRQKRDLGKAPASSDH
jgi:hypothetical protein